MLMPGVAQKGGLWTGLGVVELGGYWPVLAPRTIRLYTYEQIPWHLKGNPYITDGYRAFLPSRLCIKSLWVMSNDSGNIWSHLLGFCLFLGFAVYDGIFVLPSVQASLNDHIIHGLFLFCFQVCMLFSTGFHLFCAHRSERVVRRWLSIDHAGIAFGMLGCFLPAIYFGFYCHPFWHRVYLLMVLGFTGAIFVLTLHPSFHSPLGSRLPPSSPMALFVSLGLVGLVLAAHWVILSGGLEAPIVQEFLPRLAVMYIMAGLALLLFSCKFPECYFPGWLNVVGSSHQCWHLIVVLMFSWWHQAVLCFIRSFAPFGCHGPHPSDHPA
uniref:Progestin and adipoQ receptor family member IIIa n=1 Tax=Eptatretus burgeri TaxID=7764 RepID=A0A8C4X205_EPTBU